MSDPPLCCWPGYDHLQCPWLCYERLFSDGDLTPNRIEQARRAAHGYIDLTSSNPTHHGLLFPPEILEAGALRYLRSRRYDPDPHGNPAARDAIVRYYASRTPPLPLDIDDIFITASTSEAYGLLFALLAEPGDNLLAPEVSYPLFEYLAAAYRVELRPYRLQATRGWRIDQSSLLAQADERTRGILLISPHNPTGVVIQQPIAALERLGLPLIFDEVFAEFPYRAPHTPPLGALHPTLPVFHLNGISKLFALPDLKLGWVALSGSARAVYGDRLELLNDTFLGANSLTQSLLPALFAEGMPFVAAMRQRINANLDMALALLQACSAVQVRAPDGGYYLFFAVPGWDDEDELVLYLLSEGVLAHPGYFFGYEDGAHLMISCLTEPALLAEGVRRLAAALQRRPGQS